MNNYLDVLASALIEIGIHIEELTETVTAHEEAIGRMTPDELDAYFGVPTCILSDLEDAKTELSVHEDIRWLMENLQHTKKYERSDVAA